MTSSWIKDHPLTEGWNCRDMNRGVHSLNFTRIHDKDKLYKDYTLAVHMMTSSMETFFRVTGPLWVTGEFPSQRPVTRSFDVFFDLCLNKRLGKPLRRRWFEMLSRSLWRHCNEMRHWFHYSEVHDFMAWNVSASLDLWRGNPPVADGFPSQRASNTLNWKAGYQGLNSPWNGWLVVT